MNIFISFINAIKDPDNKYAVPCFYESFLKKLQELSHNILVYSHYGFSKHFRKIPEHLKEKIRNFSPDLVFLFNNAFYDISKIVECPIIIYEVDSPLYYSNKDAIKQNPSRYKFITSQNASAAQIHDIYNVDHSNILEIPFFTELQPKEMDVSNNIAFIGTKFYSKIPCNPYIRFMQSNPSDNERREFMSLLGKLSKDPFLETDVFLKKYNSDSIKIKDSFSCAEYISALSGFKRVSVLSAVADLGLDLYGTPEWITDIYNDPLVALSYKNKKIYSIEHNMDVYNSVKIGLNVNHIQAVEGFSWRVCDIMATNCCLVTESTFNITKYFGKISIPTFSSPWEAREQCKHLLSNENYRKDIVASCQELINSKFRFIHILPKIEEFLGVDLQPVDKFVDLSALSRTPIAESSILPRGTLSIISNSNSKKITTKFFRTILKCAPYFLVKRYFQNS